MANLLTRVVLFLIRVRVRACARVRDSLLTHVKKLFSIFFKIFLLFKKLFISLRYKI